MRRKLSVLAVIALTVATLGTTKSDSASAATSAETSAVNWALAQVGQTEHGGVPWVDRCPALRAGRVCRRNWPHIPIQSISSPTAGSNANTDPEDVWSGTFSAGTTGGSSTTPPYGALVFFDAKSGYSPEDFSHVEIMGPNGEMIGTPGTPGHAVFEETLAQHEAAGDHNTYIGWWLPDSTASSNGDGTPTTESCRRSGLPQYLVIDSHGSGESYPPETAKGVAATMAQLGLSPTLHAWPGGLSNDSLHDASAPGAAFAAELQALHRTAVVAVLGNPYPASGVVGDPIELSEKGLGAIVNGAGSVFHIGFLGSYTASVRTDELARPEVAREVTACPATKIFLTGFSQGAQATADFVQRELTANEASHLGGVRAVRRSLLQPGRQPGRRRQCRRSKHRLPRTARRASGLRRVP